MSGGVVGDGSPTGAKDHDALVKRVEGYTASAMRDSLREAIPTAQRRRLNTDEALIFQYMLNELEVRGKAGRRG